MGPRLICRGYAGTTETTWSGFTRFNGAAAYLPRISPSGKLPQLRCFSSVFSRGPISNASEVPRADWLCGGMMKELA